MEFSRDAGAAQDPSANDECSAEKVVAGQCVLSGLSSFIAVVSSPLATQGGVDPGPGKAAGANCGLEATLASPDGMHAMLVGIEWGMPLVAGIGFRWLLPDKSGAGLAHENVPHYQANGPVGSKTASPNLERRMAGAARAWGSASRRFAHKPAGCSEQWVPIPQPSANALERDAAAAAAVLEIPAACRAPNTKSCAHAIGSVVFAGSFAQDARPLPDCSGSASGSLLALSTICGTTASPTACCLNMVNPVANLLSQSS
jgi:hypothetical protein